jgi:hypothetical protein
MVTWFARAALLKDSAEKALRTLEKCWWLFSTREQVFEARRLGPQP